MRGKPHSPRDRLGLVALLLALALAACAPAATPSPTQPAAPAPTQPAAQEAPAQPVTIKLWHMPNGADPRSAIEAEIAAFQRANPGINDWNVWQNSSMWIWADGGNLLAPDLKKSAFNAPEAIKGVTHFASLYGFVYDWDELPVRLVQEQFSPVISGNERESSYPVGVLAWRAENRSDRPVRVGIILTATRVVPFAPAWDLPVVALPSGRRWPCRYTRFSGAGDNAWPIAAETLRWYAGALGLPSIAPPEQIQRTLRTIFASNVLGFADGELGAVDGMRPDGQVDTSDRKASESGAE